MASRTSASHSVAIYYFVICLVVYLSMPFVMMWVVSFIIYALGAVRHSDIEALLTFIIEGHRIFTYDEITLLFAGLVAPVSLLPSYMVTMKLAEWLHHKWGITVKSQSSISVTALVITVLIVAGLFVTLSS